MLPTLGASALIIAVAMHYGLKRAKADASLTNLLPLLPIVIPTAYGWQVMVSTTAAIVFAVLMAGLIALRIAMTYERGEEEA